MRAETDDKQRSIALFRKSQSDAHVNFDDFRVMNIIGKGTFGKVSIEIIDHYLGLSCIKCIHRKAICYEEYQKRYSDRT